MNAEEYWKALCAKNPALAEREVVTLKVTGLKAMVKQAHDKGFEHCRQVSETIRTNMSAGRNPFDDIFNGK